MAPNPTTRTPGTQGNFAASGTLPEGTTDQWRDKKRYLWLIGLVVPSLAFIAYGMWQLTGWGAWFWIAPIIVFVVVPAIDLLVGLDRSNPPDDVIEQLENDKYYRWITYLFLPIQYAAFVGAMYLIAVGDPLGGTLSLVDKIGLAISIGTIGGIGINTAHELGHKREKHERWLSKIALAQSFYGHFYIEHNRGHHVRVATPEDPASARLGENFYQFWLRTVSGSLKSAWHLEKKRYARKNKHPFRIGNDVLNAWLMSAVLWGGLLVWLGPEILPFLVLQAIVGFSLLEIVNYMEHYGMLRQKVGKPGKVRYERVDPSHSWNSNNIATNVLLYHLQRHSDHHANPTRRYQTLRDFEESPVLPTGYAGMIVLALVPAVWRRIMDHRVLEHFDGDVTLANIHPPKREKILAEYGFAPDAGSDSPADDQDAQRGQPQAAAAGAGAGAGPGDTQASSVTDESRPSQPDRQGQQDEGTPAPAYATGQGPGTAREEDVLAARCPGCGFTYEVAAGCEREGFAAGTPWSQIPTDWCCPDCGVREKADFVPLALTEV